MSVIQIFPSEEPLALAPGQTGPLVEFDMPIEPIPMFLRFVALWTDNTPLGDADPRFGIKLGEGLITTVAADGTEVGIPGPKGGGSASCRRLSDGLYLLTVVNHTESKPTWQLRIRNTADQTLRFVWVNSNVKSDTLQPWMALDQPLSIVGRSRPDVGRGRVGFVTVRNWGTGTLTIDDSLGSPIGGQDSPVVLVHRPAEIAPHGVDHLAFDCGEVRSRMVLQHTFATNDDRTDHAALEIIADPL
ncbi:hypothetical protein [Streptomyces thermodiastaticus]|uniref:hypothetical protein n=1 Tax=Streptomyces thermodiastaticus TaxID=44061 RepID=UPI00167387CF|nr:hypothetical protein [Streptomyces thermodiastaticus]MCE7549166.1 hypothetical protein [Streptomyces thermodiastaticus]GHF60646.1 hypothetical protein GCM10018787_06020 [Streptomyces thermodiastaticus]